MRVSKVKVKVNRNETMVLMHRNNEKGALIYAEIDTKDRTSDILPEKKRDSFKLSIFNKTLIRREALKGQNLDRNKYRVVEDIFKNNRLPETIRMEDILPFLNHKFQNKVSYLKGEQKIPFNLAECVLRAVEHRSINELQPYYDWCSYFIDQKSQNIARSITNNKITINDDTGKRQQALTCWEPDFIEKGSIDLTSFHERYNTDMLIAKLCSVPMGEVGDNGIPRNTNSYHRDLKKALQEHQATIFGKRDNPNEQNRNDIQLAIYHLEVVKYLEHYFPIKKSGRRNTADDIRHYLKAETLKNTISRQLENAVRAKLIQKGKYELHALDQTTTSLTLSNMKRDEAFVMNLITTSAFAGNNIRNIVDSSQLKDILGKDDFINSLGKDNLNTQAFNLFFNIEGQQPDDKTLWAMRGAVQQIRNNVAHYKKNAIETVFNITTFEHRAERNVPYSDSIFKSLFETEINKLNEAFALQLKSGGVLSYYNMDDLKRLLESVEFNLCRSVVAFAPGFRKVMKEGMGKQNAKVDELFYDLKLVAYLSKDNFLDEAWAGRYFLLKVIYNYVFLPAFMADTSMFGNTVKEVLTINKQQAQKQRNKDAYAFAEVRSMNPTETITDYMAYVQSQWIQEQNRKEEGEEDTRINFEKFVLQLFVKGFDTFLRADCYAFVHKQHPQINTLASPKEQADALNALEKTVAPLCRISKKNIDPQQDRQIAFYVYCKLLDAYHLSMLRNELIKYRQASESTDKQHLLEIIELCLLTADAIPTSYTMLYPSPEACLDRLKPFVAVDTDYRNWIDLYVQSDKLTPIVHAGIELAVKYGTANLLEQLVASDQIFKITDDNYTKWNNLKKEIADRMKKHTDYHANWVLAKEKDDLEKGVPAKQKSRYAAAYVKKHGVDYINNCIAINNYNWLNNKLHFDHLKQLHLLTVEILGRMTGFVTLWERDFQYFDQQRVKQHGGSLLKFSHGIPKEKELDAHLSYFNNMILCKDFRKIRNHIAHFNYLTQSAAKYSLVDLINALRELLHYDRKLKNAVTKAIIKIFDKHGMDLSFQFDAQTHAIVVESIAPKKIYHLGTTAKDKENALTTNQVQTAYCRLCKSLLEMKKE